jgi:HTH-type transcriptional regulator, sugar sensing transcriptional regulator
MKAVNDFLAKLGLSEIETKLYLGLLETGPTTVMELANHVGIKRITAHFNVESLETKGLVTETRRGARRQIVAEEPSKLDTLLSERESSLRKMKSDLPLVINELSKGSIKEQKEVERLKLRYFEGKKAVWRVYEEILAADSVYSFINIDMFYGIFPGTEDLFKNAFETNPKREFWAIAVDSSLARNIEKDENEKFTRYHCRYVSSREKNAIFNFANLVEYEIFDNQVAIIQSDGTTVSATVITSEVVFESFRALHKFMWGTLNSENDV